MLRIILLSLALLSPSYGMVRFRKVSKHHENIDLNQAVDEGIANFGVNLNKQLTQRAQQGENVIFSPIGIYLSLALGHLGANGQTRDEIGDVLGLPKESEWASKVHENLGEIIKRLQSQSNSNVTIANGMFVQNGCKVKDTFKQQLQSYYNHKVSNLDFNSGDATDKVNRWFSDNTRGKIENFYNDNIERDTKVLLANALCFNGNWENNFPSEQTKQETFKTEDGRQQRINMMQKTENVQYCDNQQDRYEAIGIPYKQNEYKLYLVLPREGQSLKDLANVFSSQHIQQIVSGSGSDCTQTTVDIKMPQMRLRTTHKIKDMLQQMGVRQLFESADLSNMVDQWNVKVNQVSHSIDLNVNEEGTDVCAGTTQEYKIRERQMIDEEASRQFYVQKPYMFFIYHPSTKAVICYGNVNQLSE